MDEIAAIIDVSIAKNDDIDLQALIDRVWALRDDKELSFGGDPVMIVGIGASFGESDLIVEVKTKLSSRGGSHPTWRIAKFVERVANLKTVTRTRTRIVIHDPNHDERARVSSGAGR